MSEKANMAARYEHEIPEGYEARIEGNKVIIELKESEDERIRRGLLRFLGNIADKLFALHGISKNDALAYLEKQKEQKPLMCDGEIEDKKRDIVAAIRKYYPADYAEYLTSFLKTLSPEDNSEDEYGQEMLGIAYELMYKHIPENLRTQEFWDSLKFMREYTGKVAIIHSYEKPAEWSEEEIGHLYTLARYIKSKGYEDDGEFLEGVANKLKSLRPQPHWKPSEEQMRCLLDCVSKAKEIHNASVGGYDAYRILVSLYNDLQKLL